MPVLIEAVESQFIFQFFEVLGGLLVRSSPVQHLYWACTYYVLLKQLTSDFPHFSQNKVGFESLLISVKRLVEQTAEN